MKYPVSIMAIAYSLGIIVAIYIQPSFVTLFITAAVLLFSAYFLEKKQVNWDILLLLLCFISGGLRLTGFNLIPKDHISGHVFYGNNTPIIIKGYVSASPDYRNNKTGFKFSAREISQAGLKHNTCGDILVYLKGKNYFTYGQALILTGSLRRAFGRYQDYLNKQGICSIFYLPYNSRVIRLNQNNAFSVKGLAFLLKERMESIISKRVSQLAAAILDAMVLGEKRNLPRQVNTAMIKTGTVHILVVSGFNVGIVSFMIVVFLKIIRLPKATRLYLTIVLLLIYCFLTGASTPVIRATFMGIMFILASLFQREPDIYNSLSLAAIFILVNNPNQLFDIGFQLSFISVLSIICLYPKFRSYFNVEALKIKYLRYLIDGLLVSLSAWLGTMGFIAYYFRIFSPITVVANLFIVPLASLITLCGFSLIAVEFIAPILSPFIARTSELMVWALLFVNNLLLKIPGSSFAF
ncbi:MAG: ComEC/Rec2 family competence protein [Candidatus Omnitrophota bacterium]